MPDYRIQSNFDNYIFFLGWRGSWEQRSIQYYKYGEESKGDMQGRAENFFYY